MKGESQPCPYLDNLSGQNYAGSDRMRPDRQSGFKESCFRGLVYFVSQILAVYPSADELLTDACSFQHGTIYVSLHPLPE